MLSKLLVRSHVGLAVVLLAVGWGQPLWADTTTILHSFGSSGDGSAPQDSLILGENVLYGMTYQGGAGNNGTIFKINTDGTGYTKLLDFDGTNNGRGPQGSLTLSGGTLYGMTRFGGTNDMGTAFKINTDGTGYTKLLEFDEVNNGRNPAGSLTLSGNTMYGMTYGGGTNSAGTAFKVNTDGTGYAKLLDFDTTTTGSNPSDSFALSGNILYAMTSMGGNNYCGTLFKINTDGTEYTKLLDFDWGSYGRYPQGSLTLSGNTLYGMTYQGGGNGQGTVFAMNTDGSGYAKLRDFAGASNSDGSRPFGSLTLSGSTLYGMTSGGGSEDLGTIFKINTDGTDYTIQLNFSSFSNHPYGSLNQSGNTLYGMTSGGGDFGGGVIFAYSMDIVPEPGTLALLALGGLAVRYVRRRGLAARKA